MKKSIIVSMFLVVAACLGAQNLKPYILGYESTESLSATQAKVAAQLQENGMEVIGQYQPAKDNNRAIIVFSSPELEAAVRKTGGLTGFASSLRVGITQEKGKIQVTYTNPYYWGNACFRDDFTAVSSNYTALSAKLEKTMKACGSFIGTSFGSKNGLSVKDLRKYHYMIAMPYFEDVVVLKEFSSHAEAVAKMDARLKKGIATVKLVSKKSIPGKDLTLYTLALSGEKGESKFLPIIDLSSPKHTCFLPYEVLVNGNKVVMLHGRFRIALSFPDLTMGTFTKIMSTPGDIENLMKQIVE